MARRDNQDINGQPYRLAYFISKLERKSGSRLEGYFPISGSGYGKIIG